MPVPRYLRSKEVAFISVTFVTGAVNGGYFVVFNYAVSFTLVFQALSMQ